MSKETFEIAKKLVAQMTNEEKTSQMLYSSEAIERLGIPEYNWWNEGLHGVARAGVSTMFPQAIALASSFNKQLLKDVADVISTEGRAKFSAYSKKGDRGIYKGLTFWSPNVNIFRDPRWGRGHETYGEDPYLTAQLGIAFIKGLQGEDRDNLKSAACAKHFAVHSGPEDLRHEFDAVVSKKDLYETYLYAFKRCVQDGNVESVMGAYNRVNGEPACGSKTLLTDILRNEWGFKGHVVSDCWAILDFYKHHKVVETVEESAALAVKNGCDLNCGSAFLHLDRALELGLLSIEDVTRAVEILLDTRIRLGMLDINPSPYANIPYEMVECKKHIDLSLESVRKSTVLLKNNGILPLDKKKIKNIAVIGPNANSRDALIGNYFGSSSEYITVLEGVKDYVKDEDITVRYAEGTHLFRDRVEHLANEDDRFAEALTIAEMSDLSIICVGLDANIEGEEGDPGNSMAAGDKQNLDFPGRQNELIKTITELGKPVVLVVLAGSAMNISYSKQYNDAIVQAWYPGARGGLAIAEMLFGEYSPSAKLPITLYKDTSDLPDFCDYSMKNRTYRYFTGETLYPFGYGLKYGEVKYSNQKVSKTNIKTNESLEISATITNASTYDVDEIVQVYISHDDVNCPIYQLIEFDSIKLKANESKDVSFTISPRALAKIDEEASCFVESGLATIYIGGQQPDKVSTTLTGAADAAFELTISGDKYNVEY